MSGDDWEDYDDPRDWEYQSEVKRLHNAMVYVTAKIYMNKNGEPYDYQQLLDYCLVHIGEPDDMSGDLGRMIHEWNDEQ